MNDKGRYRQHSETAASKAFQPVSLATVLIASLEEIETHVAAGNRREVGLDVRACLASGVPRTIR
jgi:hypothetical protein